MAEHGGHAESHPGNKTISSGSTHEGFGMKLFKEVVTGGGEIISEGTTANAVKFLDSVAKDFPPGISGGGGGGGGHRTHK